MSTMKTEPKSIELTLVYGECGGIVGAYRQSTEKPNEIESFAFSRLLPCRTEQERARSVAEATSVRFLTMSTYTLSESPADVISWLAYRVERSGARVPRVVDFEEAAEIFNTGDDPISETGIRRCLEVVQPEYDRICMDREYGENYQVYASKRNPPTEPRLDDDPKIEGMSRWLLAELLTK